ncbi:hypothetical protein EXIGLDRAFT_835336 [Exidia glandulosa HHB12029]|uniref:Uncharacterized protein n=1 Tax=Exidia glandulosa HHB12029 TaxID=1314781 RepID=A0A165IXN5_EXIGL|nr:hypothetical protein EXIGLDRAFT_835336 [Exidia glandulosa HHB12029]
MQIQNPNIFNNTFRRPGGLTLRRSTIGMVVLSDSAEDEFDAAELGHALCVQRQSFIQALRRRRAGGPASDAACAAHESPRTSTLTASAYGASEVGCCVQVRARQVSRARAFSLRTSGLASDAVCVDGACVARANGTSRLTASAYGANEHGCRVQDVTPPARERSTSTPGGGRRHILCIGRDLRTRSDQFNAAPRHTKYGDALAGDRGRDVGSGRRAPDGWKSIAVHSTHR